MTLSQKSWAQLPSPTTATKNNICFDRKSLETYKNEREIDRAARLAAEGALQQSLEANLDISWYQKKEVVIPLAVLAIFEALKLTILK